VGRSVHLQFARLPSGLACYPRAVLTRRPDVTSVVDPPELHMRVNRVRIDAAQVARYSAVCGFDTTAVLDGYVPLTYPHVLVMPLHLKIFAHEAFPLRPTGLIHLSNTIAAPGRLEQGMSLDLHACASNYRKTDAGLAFDMDTVMSQDGQVAWRETCVFLSRWPASAERTGGRPPRPPKAPKDSTVLAELEVNSRLAWSYARVSGDYNPIHLNDRAARYFGLRGSISHGMWSLARSIAAAPVETPTAGARLETLFLTPVQLPARVNIKQWSDHGQSKRAMCDVRTGRVHMYAFWTTDATSLGGSGATLPV
jgi:acyl dehydratase